MNVKSNIPKQSWKSCWTVVKDHRHHLREGSFVWSTLLTSRKLSCSGRNQVVPLLGSQLRDPVGYHGNKRPRRKCRLVHRGTPLIKSYLCPAEKRNERLCQQFH